MQLLYSFHKETHCGYREFEWQRREKALFFRGCVFALFSVSPRRRPGPRPVNTRKITHSAWVPLYNGMTHEKEIGHTTTQKQSNPQSHNPGYIAKSSHCGLFFSIKRNFQARCHSFNCFSRVIADSIFSVVSKYTSMYTLYFFVNPSIKPFLCSSILRFRSLVTPIYSVPFLSLASMYT